MREVCKAVAHGAAWLAVTPSVISWALRARVIGPDRALEASTQAWALVPGLLGQYLRRAFLCRTLRACAPTATIEFGTLFSSAAASIGERAYIGPRCHLGWAVIEDDALLAAGVHVPSGGRTHGIDDLSIPIRDQPTLKTAVRIGRGCWIGSAAVVMADVGRDAVVAAGAVVTRAIPDATIAGGVPAVCFAIATRASINGRRDARARSAAPFSGPPDRRTERKLKSFDAACLHHVQIRMRIPNR